MPLKSRSPPTDRSSGSASIVSRKSRDRRRIDRRAEMGDGHPRPTTTTSEAASLEVVRVRPVVPESASYILIRSSFMLLSFRMPRPILLLSGRDRARRNAARRNRGGRIGDGTGSSPKKSPDPLGPGMAWLVPSERNVASAAGGASWFAGGTVRRAVRCRVWRRSRKIELNPTTISVMYRVAPSWSIQFRVFNSPSR